MRHTVLPSIAPLLLLAACGAATTSVRTREPGGEGCESACVEASSAWSVAASGAEEAARPAPEAPLDAEGVLGRLEEHVRALEQEPREVSGEEALALSGAMMDALDAMGTELPERLREQGDTAAEALLTERGEPGAARATRDAVRVLEQAIQSIHPGSVEDRARRRTLDAFARRARDAAQAYTEGAAPGDLRADRAEATAFPEDAPEGLRRARARALEASTSARRACGIERRLSVPAL